MPTGGLESHTHRGEEEKRERMEDELDSAGGGNGSL